MRVWAKILVAGALALALTGAIAADTLELRDGRILTGRYVGGTQAQVRFEVNGQLNSYSVNDIVALTFTNNYGTPPPPPVAATPRRAAPVSSGNMVTVPAGTPLLVRMIDGVDSAHSHVGDIFHASLETDLMANDTVAARKGTDVYGRLAEAKQAGHISGSSELKLELTRIVIDGRDYPVVSGEYELKGQGRGSNTAKKVGGGAVAGAIIGAIAGGGKGAAIGAGVGSAAGAGVQVITRGQQVKVPSESLLEFRLMQPVSVHPASRAVR